MANRTEYLRQIHDAVGGKDVSGVELHGHKDRQPVTTVVKFEEFTDLQLKQLFDLIRALGAISVEAGLAIISEEFLVDIGFAADTTKKERAKQANRFTHQPR
ncbi:MAG TPA: hypothetical protein VFG51_02390 [Candidatus Saccharimonadia bacterium]|nr:hypothetical protein [Candidatus Saccharimonadia bacterium]